MSLEQRLAAVEKTLADLTIQQKTNEELSRLMREAATSAIKSAQRPGGCLYKLGDGKAAISQAAGEIKILNKEGEVTTRLSRI